MAGKLTIRVTRMAWYDNGLVYPNEIIKNYKGDTVPSWGTLAGGKEVVKEAANEEVVSEEDKTVEGETEKTETEATEGKAEEVVEGETEEVVEGEVKEEAGEEAAPDETALMEEYNALLDEAVDKNILLEDADKKTIVEQIAELKTLLGKE